MKSRKRVLWSHSVRRRRKERPYGRKRAERDVKLRFLVFCEDKVAGSTYFKGLKSELRSSNIHVKIGTEHGDPLRLVKAAITEQESAPRKRRSQGESYDEVWCVFDVEAPKPHESLDRALRLAAENGIKCAVTNPCFELWLLLHQRDHRVYLTTQQAEQMMRGLNCCYTDNKDFDYSHFTGRHREEAVRRAEALAGNYRHSVDVRARNPWTDVHRLVRKLLART